MKIKLNDNKQHQETFIRCYIFNQIFGIDINDYKEKENDIDIVIKNDFFINIIKYILLNNK